MIDREAVRTRALIIVAGVAVLATLYEAHWFFVPVALGLTLAALLYPVVGWLGRIGAPPFLAATTAVLASVALLGAIGVALEHPVRDVVTEVPKAIAGARTKLRAMGGPLARLAEMGTSGASRPRPAQAESSRHPLPERPPADEASASAGPPSTPLIQGAFGGATALLGGLVEVTLLALFILAAHTSWTEKMREAVNDPHRATAIIDGIVEARAVVARYFLVTIAINVGQAIVIALGLMLLGYPTPWLWGALTFLLEFIPYLGGLLMVVLLAVVGLADGGSVGRAVGGPALYLIVTTLQNNFVSPVAYGHGLRLNPTAILAGLIFFWGLWGIAGAFLAVPALAVIEVVARRVDALRGLAIFLSD